MSIKLKPIDEQVIVITGGSSGIGLATVELAALRGAKVVLAARSEKTIQQVAERINSADGDAIAVACDVSSAEQVENLARVAIEHFGRIDTWVNNAGQGLYSRLDQCSLEDARRLFDINFWGVVHGSLAALPHLRANGGALINVGSEVSDAYPPLLGMYAASKHAVKGFTDALRVEIEEIDRAPVSITLIQPTAVDTPFPQHARNYMDKEPMLPKPRIDPQQVADPILHAATKPTRNKTVGLMALVNTTLAKVAPTLGDKMAASLVHRQQYDEPPRHPEGALRQPSEMLVAGQTHGPGGREPQ